MMVFASGTGLVYPSSTALAVSVDARRVGAASSLLGFAQMSVGALCSFIVGVWSTGSALPTATVLLVTAGLALVMMNDGSRYAEDPYVKIDSVLRAAFCKQNNSVGIFEPISPAQCPVPSA